MQDINVQWMEVGIFDIGMTPGVQVNLCFDPNSPRKERIEAFSEWLHEEVNEILEN